MPDQQKDNSFPPDMRSDCLVDGPSQPINEGTDSIRADKAGAASRGDGDRSRSRSDVMKVKRNSKLSNIRTSRSRQVKFSSDPNSLSPSCRTKGISRIEPSVPTSKSATKRKKNQRNYSPENSSINPDIDHAKNSKLGKRKRVSDAAIILSAMMIN